MTWRTPIAPPEPHDECPHCGTIKPASFFTCRPCLRETPWELWRNLKTAQGIEHVHAKHNTLSPYRTLEACAAAVQAAKQAILQHLTLYSTAV